MTYHLAINGTAQEPVSEETLRSRIADGSVGADALCWRDGWAEWREVSKVFADILPNPSALRPPPFSPAGFNSPQHATLAQESTRKTYLKHEASIQSIGTLYLLGAFFLILAGLGALAGSIIPDASRQEPDIAASLVLFGFLLVVGLFQLRVGLWLRKLNPRARTPATVLSCIGLLGFPVGTLVNVYILYLLRSEKGAVVLSEEYQEIIAVTPHIKYRTPLVTWILAGLLVAFLVFAVVAASQA